MISNFIERNLAEVDDLTELKVTLAALHLLGRKVSPAASVTERELLAHPAVRDGLSFPAISLRPALQRAVARGTLACALIGDVPRYFAGDDAGHRAAEALSVAMPVGGQAAQASQTSQALAALQVVAHEIERFEAMDVYAAGDGDVAAMDEWLARGYSLDEIMAAVRLTLRSPRPRHLPPRSLKEVGVTLTASPPQAPSEYYAVLIDKTSRPPEEIVNFRERAGGRWPNAREFRLLRTAAGVFGLRATLDGLKRVADADNQRVDVDGLLAALAEREEAALTAHRGDAQADALLRDLVLLYETTFNVPPTGTIADEMRLLLKDVPDVATWQSVFSYALGQNKRAWPYVRKLLQNPSPDVFVPPPANETAKFAFGEYKRRVNKVLDASVANEINQLATKVVDAAVWKAAFDRSAAANALRWDYIKKVLTAPQGATAGKHNGRAKPTAKRGGTIRRPQVQYTDAERSAAEERARQRLDKRAAQPGGQGGEPK